MSDTTSPSREEMERLAEAVHDAYLSVMAVWSAFAQHVEELERELSSARGGAYSIGWTGEGDLGDWLECHAESDAQLQRQLSSAKAAGLREAVEIAKATVGKIPGAPGARKASWAVRNYDGGWNQCAHHIARELERRAEQEEKGSA